MSVLVDKQIYNLNIFDETLSDKVSFNEKKAKIFSYGLEPHGYTVRLGEVYQMKGTKPIDYGVDNDGRTRIWLDPGETVKVRVLEAMEMPYDCMALIYPKSSYVRQGAVFNTAVIDAGYEGTIEFTIFNPTRTWIPLWVGEGIAQIVFFQGDIYPMAGYNGQYQNDKHRG